VIRQAAELARLKRENARLQERLRKAELIIEVPKKSLTTAGDNDRRGPPGGAELIQSAERLGKTVGVQLPARYWQHPAAVSIVLVRYWQEGQGCTEPVASHAHWTGRKAGSSTCAQQSPFQDQAPREVYATLLDEGQYLCSGGRCTAFLDENQAVRSAGTSYAIRITSNQSF